MPSTKENSKEIKIHQATIELFDKLDFIPKWQVPILALTICNLLKSHEAIDKKDIDKFK